MSSEIQLNNITVREVRAVKRVNELIDSPILHTYFVDRLKGKGVPFDEIRDFNLKLNGKEKPKK